MICDNCLHKEVCGCEGAFDESLTYCKDFLSFSTEKTGYWIEEDMFDGDVAYRCSECNELFWLESGTPKDNEYNFCPKCGAMLIEPQESEDQKCHIV